MNQLDGITQKLIELDEDTLKAQLAIQEEEIADESTSRSASSLESLEARVRKAEKQKHEQSLTQIKNIKSKLFPEGEFQERHDNFLSYWLKTDKGNFFIAIPLGKIEDVMVISAASPLGKEMIGKKAGEEVVFNGMEYKIKDIF